MSSWLMNFGLPKPLWFTSEMHVRERIRSSFYVKESGPAFSDGGKVRRGLLTRLAPISNTETKAIF